MEIIHHVVFNTISSKELLKPIAQLNIPHETVKLLGGGGVLVAFDISESDSRWDTVFQLLKAHMGFDIYHGGDQHETFFSEKEIREAEWLRIIPTFVQGYPQPETYWPFKQFSLKSVCPECGIFTQSNYMRLKKEPNLGKNSFMSFITQYAVFAIAEVFLGLEAIQAQGYETWKVIIHKVKQPSAKVQQIYVPSQAKSGLIGSETMRHVSCSVCGITKYYPHRKGMMYFQKDALPSDVDFVETNEWFGIGQGSYREILVSNRVAQLILDKGWQGIRLKVIELI